MLGHAVVLQRQFHQLKFESIKSLLEDLFFVLLLCLLLDLEKFVELLEEVVHASLVSWPVGSRDIIRDVLREVYAERAELVEVN